MVDPERANYRPRRALIEPDSSPEEVVVEEPDSGSNGAGTRHFVDQEPDSGSNGAGTRHNGRGTNGHRDSTSLPTATTPAAGDAGSDWATSRRRIFADLEDDIAPPLYRDNSPPPSLAANTSDAPNELEDTDPRPSLIDTGHGTWVRSALTSAAQQPRTQDEEATTILPRTSSGSRNTSSWQETIDDFSDLDDDRPRLNRWVKLGLIIAAVAAVVGLGLWLLITAVRGDQQTVTPNPNPSGAADNQASAAPTNPPATLLDDNSLIKPADAKRVVTDRTWKVAVTQSGTPDQAAQPACFSGAPLEGQPAAAQTMLRTLSASGKQPPSMLHQAEAFASPAEATAAYRVALKTLGSCSELGSYLRSGWSVTGLGDDAAGVVVSVKKEGETQHHSVVLSRTGTVLNIADVAQPDAAVQISKVANALAAVTDIQCRGAAGACPGTVSVKAAPPPVGGDQPGFLATGDLPPLGNVESLWVGDAPDVPQGEFVGAQCENVNWATTPANVRIARTYLLEQGADPGFGLDEIILTMKNQKAASDFVSSVRKNVANCPKRKLTASVSSTTSVSGIGASGIKINGWTATVSQKVSKGSLKYRVGAVAAGSKVIYTFLSPKDRLDLTDSQWKDIAVRAGQRATQVK